MELCQVADIYSLAPELHPKRLNSVAPGSARPLSNRMTALWKNCIPATLRMCPECLRTTRIVPCRRLTTRVDPSDFLADAIESPGNRSPAIAITLRWVSHLRSPCDRKWSHGPDSKGPTLVVKRRQGTTLVVWKHSGHFRKLSHRAQKDSPRLSLNVTDLYTELTYNQRSLVWNGQELNLGHAKVAATGSSWR